MVFGPPYDSLYYTNFLAQLSRKRATRTYVEIGIFKGENFQHIPCEVAVGIDPSFSLEYDASKNKQIVHLYRMTSDDFFESEHHRILEPKKVDFAFIDGMHLFEFLLRDFYNIERLCHSRSLIALHDCIPVNVEMTERVNNPAGRMDRNRAKWWTGDIWKVVVLLKKHRPDLRIIGVNCPPTGLVMISNLDPSSSHLESKYLALVEEGLEMETNEASLSAYVSQIGIVRSSTVLNDHDHTLYFTP